MKAITLQQPYAELIARGEKLVENRSWRTVHRGQLAIHVGSPKNSRANRGDFAGYGLDEAALAYSAIIAVVELVECITIGDLHARRRARALFRDLPDVDMRHAFGPWCWLLANVRRLEKPIACRGGQSLWNVPDELVMKINRQL